MIVLRIMAKPIVHSLVIAGLRVGRLTVVKYCSQEHLPDSVTLSYRSQGVMYECLCDCGEKTWVPEKFLARESIKSCGCLRREILNRHKKSSAVYREVLDLRGEIKRLHSETKKLKDLGLFDQYQDDIGEQLRSYFSRLRQLGYSK